MDYTQEAESPDEFWRWTAISTISATLKSNVFIKNQHKAIYPNMYIIIFSDSGVARKASPCNFAGRLIQEAACTKFINGRASLQAVIKELSIATSDEKGNVIGGASGLLYTEELSAFAVQDPATIPLLTDLYDYHETYPVNLIGGNHKLKQVCVSLLAASNSDLFRSVYTESAIKGGLLGRTFIIKQDNARHRKSLLDLEEAKMSYAPLITHLKSLKMLKGPIKVTQEAKEMYNDWYYGLPDEQFRDKIGFSSRLGTHVLKIAIALAAARADFEMMIRPTEIFEAIKLCIEVKQAYKTVTLAAGSSNVAAQTALVLKIIAGQPKYQIERSKLVQMMLGEVPMDQFEMIMTMLESSEMVKIRAVNTRVVYELTQEGINIILGETS